jgi:hypothetical protein
MPFRDPNAGDLRSRIDAGIRERLEEALDAACLDAMVRARQSEGRPAPAAGSARDRGEYEVGLRTLLDRLQTSLEPIIPGDLRRRLDTVAAQAGSETTARLLAMQIELAKELPDYWQRFEAVRQQYASELTASGGERRGLLGRLLGRD